MTASGNDLTYKQLIRGLRYVVLLASFIATFEHFYKRVHEETRIPTATPGEMSP